MDDGYQYQGALCLLGYDPTPGVEEEVNLIGALAAGTFSGVFVGDKGSATTPSLVLNLLDGTYLALHNVESGKMYEIPHRGVVSVTADMNQIFAMYRGRRPRGLSAPTPGPQVPALETINAPVLSQPVASDGQIVLNWTHTGPADFFVIFQDIGDQQSVEIATVLGDLRSYTATGLLGNVAYTYRIQATTSSPSDTRVGPLSAPATATTPGRPDMVSGLTVTMDGNDAVLDWDEPNLNGSTVDDIKIRLFY